MQVDIDRDAYGTTAAAGNPTSHRDDHVCSVDTQSLQDGGSDVRETQKAARKESHQSHIYFVNMAESRDNITWASDGGRPRLLMLGMLRDAHSPARRQYRYTRADALMRLIRVQQLVTKRRSTGQFNCYVVSLMIHPSVIIAALLPLT
ncbi:hypothetical protein F5B17DRAFT_428838 [Nemania serpens]|nr:hypothetical protein F5B17DRAFT_428838 [Nemania serpens]